MHKIDTKYDTISAHEFTWQEIKKTHALFTKKKKKIREIELATKP